MKNSIIKIIFLIIISILSTNCKKEEPIKEVEPTVNLAIDSLVATKTDIVVWEEIYITAYTKGENLNFSWSTNHGSMVGKDSSTVKYWACYSCIGLNTVKCEVSNEYGTVSDTIMINVSMN
ncbi:MAG: hypothetical protein Kow0068_06960 [Marinilabiliales bacterium]